MKSLKTIILIFCNIFLTSSLFYIKLHSVKPHQSAGSDLNFFAQNAGIDPIYFDYQKKIVGIKN